MAKNTLNIIENALIVTVFDKFSEIKSSVNAIQIGANDGLTGDLFRNYATRPHWHSVLAEPNPLVFSELERNYADFQNASLINAFIGTQDDEKQSFYIPDDHRLASYSLKAILQTSPKRIVNKRIKRLDVPVVSLHSCASLLPGAVDVVYCDAEGFDANIVQSMPREWAPTLVLFESHRLSSQSLEEVTNFMRRRDYNVVEMYADTLCVHSNFWREIAENLVPDLFKRLRGSP